MSPLEFIHKKIIENIVKKTISSGELSVSKLRKKLDLMRFMPTPIGVKNEKTTLGSIPTLKQTPKEFSGAILYLHGGGYCVGSAQSHKDLVARLAKTTKRQAFSIDYRLAPEHVAPAARDDALESYKALLDIHDDIIIAGDSAGGGLSLNLMQVINEQNLPKPTAVVTFSPYADMSCSGETINTHADRDPMLTPHALTTVGRLYAGDSDLKDPMHSALYGEFKDFSPTLIIVGTEEVLLDDSLRLDKKLTENNVPHKLSIYEGLWHVFPMQAGLLKRGQDALNEVRDFVDAHAKA